MFVFELRTITHYDEEIHWKAWFPTKLKASWEVGALLKERISKCLCLVLVWSVITKEKFDWSVGNFMDWATTTKQQDNTSVTQERGITSFSPMSASKKGMTSSGDNTLYNTSYSTYSHETTTNKGHFTLYIYIVKFTNEKKNLNSNSKTWIYQLTQHFEINILFWPAD